MHRDKPHLCSRFQHESRLLDLLEIREEKIPIYFYLAEMCVKNRVGSSFPVNIRMATDDSHFTL